jgi:uncharacterized protein
VLVCTTRSQATVMLVARNECSPWVLIFVAMIASGLDWHDARAASFDCTKARTASDRAICATPALSAKDDELARVFNQVKTPSNADSLLAEERQWLAMRRACGGDQTCLSNWYDQRIAALKQMLNKAPAHAQPQSGDAHASTPTLQTPSLSAAEKTAPNVLPQPKQQTTGAPFVVAIDTSVSGGARLIVTGATNLPDGTHLWIWIRKPWLANAKERLAVGLAACGDNCLPLTARNSPSLGDEVVVKNGQFSDGPFTDKRGALSPGTYVLEITITGAAFNEPPDVLAIIGSRGENMTGPLVGGCCFASHMDQAEVQKEMDNIRKMAPEAGASIYYGRYVEIGYQTAAPQAPAAPASSGNVNKDFTDCLLAKAKDGQFSSFDGGKSAMRLLGECPDQWKAYVDACMRSGDTDGNCTLRSGALAQVALKLLGK